MSNPKINIITSIYNDNIIGSDKKLTLIPNHIKRLKTLTDKKPIIMGRNTQDILKYPIIERVNIVLSRNNAKIKDGFVHAKNIEESIKLASSYNTKNIFVIGGQSIFEQFLPFVENIYITEIYSDINGNKSFPELNYLQWELTDKIEFNPDENNKVNYSFVKYSKK